MATKKKKAAKRASAKRAPAKRPPARRQPETLRLRAVAPSLTTTDLQRSIAFYRDVLGFIVGEEWREKGALMGVEIQAGAVTFMLGQDDFAKGRDRQKGVGTRIYCYTAQDIDRLAAQIRERGGALDQEPKDMPWGDRAFMISDPDGFKLTFVRGS
jgi:lactoylglutathione lyase